MDSISDKIRNNAIRILCVEKTVAWTPTHKTSSTIDHMLSWKHFTILENGHSMGFPCEVNLSYLEMGCRDMSGAVI